MFERRLTCRCGVFTVSFLIVLAATTATAQPSIGTATETVDTRRDVNGKDLATEKVVTQRNQVNDEERVVIEIYWPSTQEGRLALTQRINRVRTGTNDGNQTVEETAERNPATPSDPLRVTQRIVTTIRRDGTDSYVSERDVFQRDVNGRFVLVHRQTEHAP